MQESIALIEPLMPPSGNRKLEDLASSLLSAADEVQVLSLNNR